MFLDASKIRVVFMIAGLVLGGVWFAMVGTGGGSTILVDFGMYPDDFLGCEVEIDGEVVGELKMFGNATRTGFAVKDGKHVVRVLHPEYASDAIEVDTGTGARSVSIILDFQSVQRDGRDVAMITQY